MHWISLIIAGWTVLVIGAVVVQHIGQRLFNPAGEGVLSGLTLGDWITGALFLAPFVILFAQSLRFVLT